MILDFIPNFEDQLSLVLTCRDMYDMLNAIYPKYEGPHGKCIVCGIKPRCTKNAKAKRQKQNDIIRNHFDRRNRTNIISNGGTHILVGTGLPRIAVSYHWRIHLTCGCRIHPTCKTLVDMEFFRNHILTCQKAVRFCKKCGIPINNCKHAASMRNKLPFSYKSDGSEKNKKRFTIDLE